MLVRVAVACCFAAGLLWAGGTGAVEPAPAKAPPAKLKSLAEASPKELADRYRALFPDLYMGGLTKVHGGWGWVDGAAAVAWIDTCAPRFGLSQVVVFTADGRDQAALESASCIETVTLEDVNGDGIREMVVQHGGEGAAGDMVSHTTYLFWRDGGYRSPLEFITLETSIGHALKDPAGRKAPYSLVREVTGKPTFLDKDDDGFRETVQFDKSLKLQPGPAAEPAWTTKALAELGWAWGEAKVVETQTWTYDAQSRSYILTRRGLVTDQLPPLTP